MKFLLTDDASQYFRLLGVKTVRGIGQQMFANFRTLIKFVFVDSGYFGESVQCNLTHMCMLVCRLHLRDEDDSVCLYM